MIGKYKKFLLLLTVALVLFPKTTYAYLDPGSGSYIFQIIIASILGLIFTLKLFWVKLVRFIKLLLRINEKEKLKED